MVDEVGFTRLQSFLRPFPDPGDVFADPVERYAWLMDPLVSIELSEVDPEWVGWIHLVSPVEPIDEYLGTNTCAYASYYTRENWIGFRLDESDRYHLLGDWRIFEAESPDETVRRNPELVKLYERRHTAYQATKSMWHDHGLLVNVDSARRYGLDWALANPRELIDSLGGDAYPGNWADEQLFPLEFDENAEADPICCPLTEDGRRFRFVGAVPNWSYGVDGADSILLFYDPTTRIALETFDYT